MHKQDGGLGYIDMLADMVGILWSVLIRGILVDSLFLLVTENVAFLRTLGLHIEITQYPIIRNAFIRNDQLSSRKLRNPD